MKPGASGAANVVGSHPKGDVQPIGPALNLDYARTVQVETAGGGAWIATVDVIVSVTGRTPDDELVTDAILIPANSPSGFIAQGVVPFAVISTLAWTTPAGWTGGNIFVEYGPAFHVPSPIASSLAGISEVNVPAVGAALHAPLGAMSSGNRSYTPTTAPDGTASFVVYYDSVA